jgi:hypothetical protein
MNKLIGSAVMAALLCGGVAWSSDYQEMQNWLFESYVHGMNEKENPIEYYQQKNAFYAFMGTIEAKVKQEYPVDPQLTKQVNDLKAAYEAARTAKLLEFGIKDQAGYDAYYTNLKYNSKDGTEMAKDPLMSQLNALYTELQTSTQNVMQAYNDEFRKRYEAAFIEAVKKFQENGATMK